MNRDALPRTGSWSNGENVWAPSVLRRKIAPIFEKLSFTKRSAGDDGVYVMYYSAASAQSPAHHCNGAATSTNPLGPYEPVNETLGNCQLSQGGSIDPSG